MQSALKSLVIAAGLLVVCGCTTPRFKEAGKSRPHGALIFTVEESTIGSVLRAPQVVPLKINGLAPNIWTKWNIKRYNVPPGDMQLLLQAPLGAYPVAICSLEFKVEPDQVYSIQAIHGDDMTKIRVLDAGESEVAACESRRMYNPQNETVPLILPIPL